VTTYSTVQPSCSSFKSCLCTALQRSIHITGETEAYFNPSPPLSVPYSSFPYLSHKIQIRVLENTLYKLPSVSSMEWITTCVLVVNVMVSIFFCNFCYRRQVQGRDLVFALHGKLSVKKFPDPNRAVRCGGPPLIRHWKINIITITLHLYQTSLSCDKLQRVKISDTRK